MSVVVGTAGHIDHGKTTLVEKLTGMRADRPYERERGMTIDIGYAALSRPGGQREEHAFVVMGGMGLDAAMIANTSGDLKKGSPAVGAKDSYKLDVMVAKTTQFSGTITRMPNLFSSILSRKKQDAQLNYSIDLAVLNPKDTKQRKVVGKWVGMVPIDPGKWMLHCHVLEHAEAGMMTTVVVP